MRISLVHHRRIGWPLLAVLSAVIFCIPNLAVAQGLQWMHMVGPGAGWVASSVSVFWTTDNGQHWKDITPPRAVAGESVASVFFLNASTGWALLTHYEMPQPRFDLAATQNAGSTWSVSQIHLPGDAKYPTLVTEGYLQFLDANRGWMNLSVESSSAYHSGLLLRTIDGGKNWTLPQG